MELGAQAVARGLLSTALGPGWVLELRSWNDSKVCRPIASGHTASRQSSRAMFLQQNRMTTQWGKGVKSGFCPVSYAKPSFQNFWHFELCKEFGPVMRILPEIFGSG